MQQEIQNYIQKLFLINHKEEYIERIHFITPEHIDKFSSHFSLSKFLYYSPVCLTYIKSLIEGKFAYIVPSIPNREDKYIGQYLEIPLLCGDIAAAIQYRRRDYARELLKEIDIPLVLGEEFIFSEGDLINKLSLLIIKNPQITTYFVKLNTEINGRGIATIQLENVKYFRKLRRAVNYQFTEKRVQKIRKIIEDILPLKLIPCMNSLFLNYYEFRNRIYDTGCVIEAAPTQTISGSSSVTMRIDPDGLIQQIASFDKIMIHEVITCGATFPQRHLGNLDLNKLCQTIGEKVYSKNIWGYVKVDYIVFSERQKESFRGQQKGNMFQVIGIDIMLDSYTSAFFLFDFLCEGQLLPNNKYVIQNPSSAEEQKSSNASPSKMQDPYQHLLRQVSARQIQQESVIEQEQNQNLYSEQSQPQHKEKFFTYIPMVFHKGLQEYKPKQFFSQCREQQIAFDIQNMNGTIFILPGSLSYGMLNIICIGNELKVSVSNMVESINFLVNKFGDRIRYHIDKDKNRSDNFYLVDVLGSIRDLNKVLEMEI